jgi:hypothetical protein
VDRSSGLAPAGPTSSAGTKVELAIGFTIQVQQAVGLGHQPYVKQEVFGELTDRLNQERAVAKNRESVLKKQLVKVKQQK